MLDTEAKKHSKVKTAAKYLHGLQVKNITKNEFKTMQQVSYGVGAKRVIEEFLLILQQEAPNEILTNMAKETESFTETDAEKHASITTSSIYPGVVNLKIISKTEYDNVHYTSYMLGAVNTLTELNARLIKENINGVFNGVMGDVHVFLYKAWEAMRLHPLCQKFVVEMPIEALIEGKVAADFVRPEYRIDIPEDTRA